MKHLLHIISVNITAYCIYQRYSGHYHHSVKWGDLEASGSGGLPSSIENFNCVLVLWNKLPSDLGTETSLYSQAYE